MNIFVGDLKVRPKLAGSKSKSDASLGKICQPKSIT